MLTLPRLTCPQLFLNCPASISSQSLAQDHAWTTKRPPSVAGATRLEVAPVGCMATDLGRGATHKTPPVIYTSLYLPAPYHENPLRKDCVGPSTRLLRHPSFPSRAALLACPVLPSPAKAQSCLSQGKAVVSLLCPSRPSQSIAPRRCTGADSQAPPPFLDTA
jgi:hypothetical protein